MTVAGSHVGIVGGSIAGCSAAIVLRRLGCDAHVFQRSRNPLEGRGAGIVIPISLVEELIGADLLPSGYPHCRYAGRRWIIADGSPGGRVVWESPMSAATNNWGVLWGALRGGVPDDAYHAGNEVKEVDQDGAGLTLADGNRFSTDVVVGADGYRSIVRRLLHADANPTMAPYVLWRGDFEEARVPDPAVIDESDAAAASFTVPFGGGHAVIYLIPGDDGSVTTGRRRVNWAVYTSVPPGIDPAESPFVRGGEIPDEAHAFFESTVERGLPPQLAALVSESSRDEVWIQPIYDKLAERYAGQRVMLIGDAATVTRPHTASGATKALQDAVALGRIAANEADWPEILSAYDAERSAEGNRLVLMGRRLGRAQVESPPDWARMSPGDFESWSARMTAGDTHHLFSDK